MLTQHWQTTQRQEWKPRNRDTVWTPPAPTNDTDEISEPAGLGMAMAAMPEFSAEQWKILMNLAQSHANTASSQKLSGNKVANGLQIQ